MHNWRWILTVLAVCAGPAIFLWHRWLRAWQRQRALFQFSLAEASRARGEHRQALALYHELLSGFVTDDLRWRACLGRAQSLLSIGEPMLAAGQAREALHWAEKIQFRQSCARGNAQWERDKAVLEGKEPTPPQPPPQPADELAALAAAPLPLALLRYTLAKALDASGYTQQADEEFSRIHWMHLDQEDSLKGIERREFNERIKAIQAKANAAASSASNTKPKDE